MGKVVFDLQSTLILMNLTCVLSFLTFNTRHYKIAGATAFDVT